MVIKWILRIGVAHPKLRFSQLNGATIFADHRSRDRILDMNWGFEQWLMAILVIDKPDASSGIIICVDVRW